MRAARRCCSAAAEARSLRRGTVTCSRRLRPTPACCRRHWDHGSLPHCCRYKAVTQCPPSRDKGERNTALFLFWYLLSICVTAANNTVELAYFWLVFPPLKQHCYLNISTLPRSWGRGLLSSAHTLNLPIDLLLQDCLMQFNMGSLVFYTHFLKLTMFDFVLGNGFDAWWCLWCAFSSSPVKFRRVLFHNPFCHSHL